MNLNAAKMITGFFTVLIFFIITTAFGQENGVSEDNSILEKKVKEWNDAHAARDIELFGGLYDKEALYYGQKRDKLFCIQDKLILFNKAADYSQSILGEIVIVKTSDSVADCRFVKHVTTNKITKDYPSYLVFKKLNDGWRIITEGDSVTDKNLAKRNRGKKAAPENSSEGDFNGDGKIESMRLEPPVIIEDDMACQGDCVSFIKFSDNSIPPIKVENCIGGQPVNLGDLDKNGSDEIGLIPDWFTSCWRNYFVWTFKNGKWVNAINPFTVYICDDEITAMVKPDPRKKGYVIIRYSDMNDFKTKTKSVKLNN
jgi:hypothetical protein